MSRLWYYISVAVIAWLPCTKAAGNVYIVIYATINGHTGHAGIAADNYRIQRTGDRTDTVADGTLTYYDLWPDKDDFVFMQFSKNRPARFYKLPNAIWPAAITVASLYDNGIPHREHYPCNALLMLRTAPATDYALIHYLDSAIQSNRCFNPRYYNCSDFVAQAVGQITGNTIRAKEFVPLTFSTTPNRLCRKLLQRKDIVVIKSPGATIKGSFWKERILKKKKRLPVFLATH